MNASSGCTSGAALLLAFAATGLQADGSRAEPPKRTISVLRRETPHLRFTAALSPTVIAPGTRMSIVVDVVPKKGMHVYAPGTQYRPIAIALEPDPSLRVHETVYPEPTRYLFKPLNEEVLVYGAPFRLIVDLTAVATGERAPVSGRRRIAVTGKLEYQACDDRVCYLPTSVPLKWNVTISR